MWSDGPVYEEDVNLETFGSSCFTPNTHLGNQTGDWGGNIMFETKSDV